MSRLSPAGILVVGAFLVPVAIELPVVLAFLGIDFPEGLSFGMAALAFVLVLIWSEVSEPAGSSTKS